ncbi:MAG: cyclic nucleotide-binding domain-containing protein [Chloroflexi bacterium]|nr:cyclic nucleotide-binding domain-containing protein [Chloroflexota bacterium]
MSISEQSAPARLLGNDIGEDAPFLSHWDDQDWAKLLISSEPHSFRSGEIVARHNEVERSLSILVDGVLDVETPASEGQPPRHIAQIQAGSVMGEQSFLDGLPRSAQVRASTNGEMLTLTLAAFQTFASRYPDLAAEFLFDLGRILSLRLRSTTVAATAARASRLMRVADHAALPVQNIELDQASRNRQVDDIASSPYFKQLQVKARIFRHQA